MGMLEDITKKINTTSIASAIISEFFPETLGGFITEYFSGMSAKEFYHLFKNTNGKGTILDFLDEQTQHKLLSFAPDDLSWLTFEWVVDKIGKESPGALSVIASSPSVRDGIQRQIDEFKRRKILIL